LAVFASMECLSKTKIVGVLFTSFLLLAGCASQSFDPDKAP
jgi:hypothetical protein